MSAAYPHNMLLEPLDKRESIRSKVIRTKTTLCNMIYKESLCDVPDILGQRGRCIFLGAEICLVKLLRPDMVHITRMLRLNLGAPTLIVPKCLGKLHTDLYPASLSLSRGRIAIDQQLTSVSLEP
jgi:hypothetical protein